MNRTFTILASIFVCGALMSPEVMAQERGRGRNNGGGGSGHRTEQQARPAGNRPGNMGGSSTGTRQDRPNSSGVRPNNSGNHSNGYNRPGNNGNHNNGYNHSNGYNRPNNGGNHGNHNNGYNHSNGYNRPGNNGYRPNHSGHNRPAHSYGYRPHHDHGWVPPYHAVAPRRSHMYCRPWTRPVPPAHFRPHHGAPRLSTVLGVTLGTALNISLNALLNGGYNVTGYGPSAVYLNGVNYYDCYWPDVTFNYNDSRFCNGEFVYSTSGYDRSRYNRLFQQLTSSYGAPVSTNGDNGAMTATWWGYDNGYITLSYFSDYANNGRLRYYTVLSMGN